MKFGQNLNVSLHLEGFSHRNHFCDFRITFDNGYLPNSPKTPSAPELRVLSWSNAVQDCLSLLLYACAQISKELGRTPQKSQWNVCSSNELQTTFQLLNLSIGGKYEIFKFNSKVAGYYFRKYALNATGCYFREKNPIRNRSWCFVLFSVSLTNFTVILTMETDMIPSIKPIC